MEKLNLDLLGYISQYLELSDVHSLTQLNHQFQRVMNPKIWGSMIPKQVRPKNPRRWLIARKKTTIKKRLRKCSRLTTADWDRKVKIQSIKIKALQTRISIALNQRRKLIGLVKDSMNKERMRRWLSETRCPPLKRRR